MYHFTVPMALMGFLPVGFFGVSACLLLRDLYGKMSRDAFTLFSSGMVSIFAAGFLKALWKLLYAAGICDFQALNTLFLPLQSLGFLLSGIGIVLLLVGRKSVSALAVPPVFSGSVIFISMMVLGLGTICTVLSILAVKLKKKYTTVLFALAFLVSMGMGAISGLDFTQAWANWLEQGINTLGQGLLMLGVLILHRNGLKSLNL